jgi:hypothetical protein
VGTFTIARTGHAPARQDRLQKMHRQNGFNIAATHNINGWTINFYTKQNRSNACFLDLAETGFIGVAGSLIYDGVTGAAAARKMFDHFDGTSIGWHNSYGSYTVIIRKFGRLFIFADRLGLNKIYLDASGSCLSNSFASTIGLMDQCTPDPVGVYIYAWLALVYGDRTFVNEIKPAPPNSLIEVNEKIDVRQLATPIDRTLDKWTLDFEETADFYIQRMRKLFAALAANFGGRINCSLSGGYDSRLVLALALDAGIKPRTYVYGPASDPDVIIAKQLASTAGLDLDWVDKGGQALPSPEGWPARLAECSFALDGWANGGLVNGAHTDFETRLSRTNGDRVLLLGTAGEVFRNFFYLPDRPYNLEQFVRAIFCRFDPDACGPRFSAEDYVSTLVADIQKVTGSRSIMADRRQIEQIYPLLRARHMFGRDMVLNQRFGWAFSPFLEPAIFEGAHNIPLHFKTLGNLERRMIQKLNPAIAACPSAYGHPFSEAPPMLSKLRYYLLDHYRPLWLRERSYRMQHLKPQAMPAVLRDDYLKAIIDTEFPFMRSFFSVNRVHDAGVMNRLVTMEYVFQKANGG